MSVHAGTIVHVGGNNVIDRVQRAGIGDAQVPVDIIRETGNPLIVDKIPGDPDFSFTLETLDVTTEVEAWLTGQWAGSMASASAADLDDADGTAYHFSDCGFVNVTSPWKAATPGGASAVVAGHLLPGYYASRWSYQFGVSDNSQETFELSGGAYYYNGNAPIEEQFAGTGSQTAFPSTNAAVPYRIGGVEGASFKSLFGVMVDGVLQTEGVDFTQSPSDSSSAAVATVTFTTAPASGAKVRFCYFTTAAQTSPQSVHASTVVKPAAVRGRHVCVYLGSGATRAKLGGVQAATLEASADFALDREMCNTEVVGITVNGRNVNGSVTVRAKDPAAFLAVAAKVTGLNVAEVIGWLNTNQIPLEIVILNPKNPSQTLKTLYVDDAVFTVPGTNAQVNQPTDFAFRFESAQGDMTVYKGAKP